MGDPRDRGGASLPPTLGEGCVRRFDPQALNPQSGTDFPGAAELWRQLQQAPDKTPETPQEK